MKRKLIVIIEPEAGYIFDWDEALEQPDSFCEELFLRYKKDPLAALLFLGFQNNNSEWSESLRYLWSIASSFVHLLTKMEELESRREKVLVDEDAETFKSLIKSAPFICGSENLSIEWLSNLWINLNHTFCTQIKAFKGTVSDYLHQNNPALHLPGRVYFHLVENKSGEEPFAFLATYTTYSSQKAKSRHLPLKNALEEYGDNTRKMLELLSTVNKASEKSSLIAEVVQSGEIFYPLNFSAVDAYTFLKEVSLYEESGIICRIPDWYRKKQNSLSVAITIGDKKKSYFSQDTLLSFDISISLGADTISVKQAKQLLSEAEGLTMIKNRWVEVDHQRLKEVIKLYEKAESEYVNSGITLSQAIRIQLNEGKLFTEKSDSDEIEVNNGTWLTEIMAGLTRPESLPDIDAGNNFNAVLRGYQLKGLNWLHYLNLIGLGACLADDMGLGKTIQVIAHLNHLSLKQKKHKSLIVIPASLIGNWVNEIKRFTPSLRYHVVHPSNASASSIDDVYVNKKGGVYITTYAILVRNKWFSQITWDYLILDEAQAIKNPNTKQAKAVKVVPASYRLALTGTPVENSLMDLWSIFDFINPGLLGTSKEFISFTKSLSDNPEGYTRLKKIISPFILRRLKTDTKIISDLPEKIEMKTYSNLTPKQALLYQNLVKSLRNALDSTEDGISRKGLILASIMKFKQICNHPDQYTGQDNYSETDSGKFERLREICETIKAKRERVLVFTQFKEITEHLSDYLARLFGHSGLVLHGGIAVKKRKDLVEAFQGREYVPYMILSIKAGGTGLNLTAANHVIHFDRWWNPAVENQATDRVFRIGQKKNVIVHKFITAGTIEEKIDLMIDDKTKLVNDILPEKQENWLTEMSNDEIMQLVSLV